MNIQDWWPRLDASTRQWLVENNGDIVPPDVQARIAAVAEAAVAGDSWLGDGDPAQYSLSDEAVDWIEAAANGEGPEDV
jgi:hypothetical protein